MDPWLLALNLELDGERKVRPDGLSNHRARGPAGAEPELNEVHQLEWNPTASRVEEQTQLRYEQLVLEESRRRAKPSPEAGALLRKAILETG